MSDLNKEIDKARSTSQVQARSGGGSGDPGDLLRTLFFSIPGGEGGEMSRDLDAVERIRAGPAQGGKRPEDMSPQELHAVLWQVLTFRDSGKAYLALLKTFPVDIELCLCSCKENFENDWFVFISAILPYTRLIQVIRKNSWSWSTHR